MDANDDEDEDEKPDNYGIGSVNTIPHITTTIKTTTRTPTTRTTTTTTRKTTTTRTTTTIRTPPTTTKTTTTPIRSTTRYSHQPSPTKSISSSTTQIDIFKSFDDKWKKFKGRSQNFLGANMTMESMTKTNQSNSNIMVSLVDNLSGNKTHDSNDDNDEDLGVDMYSSDPNKKEPALTTEKDEDSDEDSGDNQVKMLANNNEHVTSTVKYELGDKSSTLLHQQVNRELSGMDTGQGENKEGYNEG